MSDVVRVTISDTPAAVPGAVVVTPAVAPAADAVVTPAVAAVGDRPAWLPAKFATPEAMAESYAALEKKQGSAVPIGTDPLSIVNPPAPVVAPVAASAALAAAYTEAEAAAGVISPETYTKLEKAGLDKAAVDTHVAGQRAIVTQQRAEVFSAVGGPEEFGRMIAWAKAGGLTAQEQAAHNAIIKSGNIDMMKLAAGALAGKYKTANGSEASLVNAEGGQGGNAGASYASRDEQTKAIQDPRYKTDPAYREAVQTKIGNSPF